MTAASLPAGSGPLQGTTTVTVSGGIATFTNLADNKAETITLQFTSVPSHLRHVHQHRGQPGGGRASWSSHTEPSATATAGVVFATQPVVYVEDRTATSKLATTRPRSRPRSQPPGSGPLQGTTTETVSGGIATFTDLADNKAETIALQFTSVPVLTFAISSSIAVSPAGASQLLIATQPSATATAGQQFATQPVVYVEDQYGNLETGDNKTQVTAASLPAGSGPLQGTTTETVSGGIATFTDLADNKAETISLQFTSVPVLTSAIPAASSSARRRPASWSSPPSRRPRPPPAWCSPPSPWSTSKISTATSKPATTRPR